MAHADMAVGIDHVFVGENAIGDHKVAQEIFELGHQESIGLTTTATITREPSR
jgi:hypothetical protein